MAEEKQEPAIVTTAPGSVYREEPKDLPPERGGLGYAYDKAVGVAQGLTDIPAAVAAVGRDVAYDPDYKAAAQATMEAMSDAKRKLGESKTKWGQAQEAGTVAPDDSVPGAILDSLPASAAIALSGPFAPVTGGVLAHGIERNAAWDRVRRTPDDKMQEENPDYAKLRDDGMSIADAKQEIFSRGNTWTSVGANVTSNAVMAGLGQTWIKGVLSPALKTQAGGMLSRVLKGAGVGVAEGGIGGGVLGGGSEFGHQAAEMGMGFRKEGDYDWDKIGGESWRTAKNLGIIGGTLGAIGGVRAPVRPPEVVKKALEGTEKLVDNTGYTPQADEIGSDLMIVTGAELGRNQPSARPSGPPNARAADVTRPGTPGPGEVTPPGIPRPGEVPPPAVTPQAPAGAPPPVTSPPRPAGPGAAPAPAAPVEPLAAARPRQEVPAEPTARPAPAEVGAEAAAPVAEAVPAEPVKAPMTVDELKARAGDINQTPDYGTLQQHIAEWRRDNPNETLSEHNAIQKINREARAAESKRISDEKLAAIKTERDARVVQAAQAAAEAKAEPAPVPGGAPSVAQTIQERVAAAKTRRAAEDQPVAGAPIEPTIGEKAEAKVEEPKPPPEVTTPSKALTPQEKIEQAIAEGRTKAADIAKAQDRGTEKLVKAEAKADEQGNTRENQKTKREAAAKASFEAHDDRTNEIAPLEDIIQKGKAKDVVDQVARVGDVVRAMTDDYHAKLKDLRGGAKTHPVYEQGKWGAKARAGHGDYHSLMAHLTNLSNGITHALEDGEVAVAKARAKGVLDLVKRTKEGKLAEITAEKKAESQRQTVERKTSTLGEGAERVRDEAPSALDKMIRKEDLGEGSLEDHLYPSHTLDPKDAYVGGKMAERDADKADGLRYALDDASRELGGEKLSDREAAKIFEEHGEKIKKGKVSDVLAKYRPGEDQPELRAIFDAVYDITKNMPVEVWSRDMFEAYSLHKKPDARGTPLGMYSTDTGRLVFRHDTLTPLVVFHEAVHAATSRAVLGSERLQALVGKLQDIVENRLKGTDAVYDIPFQRAIRMAGENGEEGKRVNVREFIAELFSRPEVANLLKDISLRPKEAAELKALGYRADIGKSILKSLWDGFLKAIGFKARTPNAFKVSVDMLQDMFEREMKIRESDADQARPTGAFFDEGDMINLAAEDPKGGPGIVKAWRAGDFPAVTNGLMNSAHLLSEGSLDKSIKFLKKYNEDLYGQPDYMVDPNDVTPMSNTEQVHSGVAKFLNDRFGDDKFKGLQDLAYQADKRFETPIRHMMLGWRYTEDLGNNLGKAFRDSLVPLKTAWSRREHFAQKYMDVSGANKLIDDLATLKHGIADRDLWTRFENLLVRESYTRAFADEELGVGRNSHINTGSLRDIQSVADHKANQAEFRYIREHDPSGRLVAMRNRIHEFEAADLENRKRAQANDMLTRMNIVAPEDTKGMMAVIKDVRKDKLTAEDNAHFERIVGKDHNSPQFKEYQKNREVIRAMLDQTDKNGPHVPFMRHGNHVVTAKYHIRPDEGVKYLEMNPGADLQKGYAFEDRADAEAFARKLSRPDIQITQTGGREVVYDTRTGEAAKIYRIEHPDGTATTFENRAEAEAAMGKGDEMKAREITPEDVQQRIDNNQPTSHFKTYHRIEFNPQEYVRFESEREANAYRDRINQEDQYSQYKSAGGLGQRGREPTFHIEAANVESMRDILNRGVATHASAEMTQWVNRVEASPAYQKMTPEAQADWKRELNAEAARVTMMTGRRSINLPREYVKGASTDILKNMIQSSGASARAIAGNMFNARIDKGREKAKAYVDIYKNQSGGEGRNHRARQDVLDEIDRRLHAPIRVEDSWTRGIKRALQVSMISHLADTGFLIINAMEPWILGGAITASRHGWAGAYRELGSATRLIDPINLAKEAGREMGASARGEYRPANYERILLDRVTGAANTRGDGALLGRLMNHMFGRGMISRDSGMEAERIHDPSSNIIGRGMDRTDAFFRGANGGVETLNRGILAISNFRLEYAKALREGKTAVEAEEIATRYAEDQVFKGAGDYSSWNSPRFFNNPWMKAGTQFRKYPLRIASVYADAIVQAVHGDKQAMYQVAYMLGAQGLASGLLGLPTGVAAGTVNTAYILGLSDEKWGDKEFAIRKWFVDQGFSPLMTDAILHGALRFTGADMSGRLGQNTMLFSGDPDSRGVKPLGNALLQLIGGAPLDYGEKALGGIQKVGEAYGHWRAGANQQAWQSGMQGVDGILQIKQLHNIAVAMRGMMSGPLGMPKGNEYTTGQAVTQAVLGFQPAEVARKQEEKRTVKLLQTEAQAGRLRQVNRWLGEDNPTSQSAIWADIQKNYNPTVSPDQRINYSDLWKAKIRKEQQARRDKTGLGLNLSGRSKGYGDIGKYFSTQ